MGRADNHKVPFAADQRERRFGEGTFGTDEDVEDHILAEDIGDNAGYDSGGAGVGHGRSRPAILRGSPRFPPAQMVEIDELLQGGGLARSLYGGDRVDDERFQAGGLQQLDVADSKSEASTPNRMVRSRQTPSFPPAPQRGRNTRDCR